MRTVSSGYSLYNTGAFRDKSGSIKPVFLGLNVGAENKFGRVDTPVLTRLDVLFANSMWTQDLEHSNCTDKFNSEPFFAGISQLPGLLCCKPRCA
jgi:hypothetical protein